MRECSYARIFLVDFMMGRLCRWLRLIGYDAEFFRGPGHRDILYRSVREGRTIITRNSRLSARKAFQRIVVASDLVFDQLDELVRADIICFDRKMFFSRCLICNVSLIRAEKNSVREFVPEFVFSSQSDFSACPICRKIYWKGTHWDLALNQLIYRFHIR